MSLLDLWGKIPPGDSGEKVILSTHLSPEECLRCLSEGIDTEESSIFSISGYKGTKEVIGRIYGWEFHLQRRRYWRNDFAPCFFGIVVPATNETEVVGHFDFNGFTKNFMRLWLVMVAFMGVFAALMAFVQISAEGLQEPESLLAFLFIPLMIAFGIALPKVGRMMATDDERYLIDFLKTALSARIDDP